ncbi:hypothetical protein FF011L_37960 [Roseimaritima multifibrata]|uniref:Uncharacterized protein n=1 Tax=Roseimaritima multifibrata TaxID=1930274 RepID=A0A517MJE4_9BACT|nr:hypothetical protein FF011L_37960 [Roseimaritima multifibrata]
MLGGLSVALALGRKQATTTVRMANVVLFFIGKLCRFKFWGRVCFFGVVCMGMVGGTLGNVVLVGAVRQRTGPRIILFHGFLVIRSMAG